MSEQTACRKQYATAIAGLLCAQPFFGALALRLHYREDSSCETAYTDGHCIAVNPEWFMSLNADKRRALIAHEVMHVSNGHCWRRDGRQGKKWNHACDYAVDNIIDECGFSVKEYGFVGPQFANMSAEAIYAKLPDMPEGNGPNGKSGMGFGEVRDSPNPQKADEEQAQWNEAVIQAAMAAKKQDAQGKLPQSIERMLAAIKQPAVRSLVAALREFVSRVGTEDYSWCMPNTRYLSQGLYLPSLNVGRVPPVAVGVDTSGSITDELLAEFAGALQVVLDEAMPESLTVYPCDADIPEGSERVYVPGEEISSNPRDYPGGGGTDFRPVFSAIDAQDTPPCCAVYLTDLYGSFPSEPPEYPVLWVVQDIFKSRPVAPFGTTLYLD